MERTRKAGVKLNDEKCVIKTKECNFFGMLYTPDGVKPSPDKVRAIKNLEPPKDKKELHTYKSSFIPNLDDTAPLRNLLKANIDKQLVELHSSRKYDCTIFKRQSTRVHHSRQSNNRSRERTKKISRRTCNLSTGKTQSLTLALVVIISMMHEH